MEESPLKDGISPETDILSPDMEEMIQFLTWMKEPWFQALMLVLIVWAMTWKGMALWRAARNSQLIWFIVLLLGNTVGILEITYILFFQKKVQKRSK